MRTILTVLGLTAASCSAAPADDTTDAGDGGRRCRATTDCDDSIACTVDTCGPAGLCEWTPVDALCEDGETCEVGRGCGTAGCRSSADCDDAIACTVDTCAVGNVCEHNPLDGLCAAAERCDPTAGCVPSGECIDDGDCDDAIACTLDACVVGNECQNLPQDALCGDGQVCNPTSGCYTPVPCETADDCPVDNFCDGTPRCEPEFGCQPPSAPRDCADSDPCTDDVCDRDAGRCVYTPNCSEAACVLARPAECLWNGCYDLDTNFAQRCAMGAVNYDINRLCFSLTGPVLNVQTRNGGTNYFLLTQAPGPSDFSFDAALEISGGCVENYRITGFFPEPGGTLDPEHLEVDWTATYTDFDEFSCALSGCRAQSIHAVGTRVP